MSNRVRTLLGRLWRARAAPPPPAPPPAPTFESEVATTSDGAAWLQARRRVSRMYSSLSDERIATLKAGHPEQAAATTSQSRLRIRFILENA